MTFTINLPPTTEARLKERAAESGQDVEEYVRSLIEEAVSPHAGMSFDALLAPVRRDFEESGDSEEELEQLVEKVREAAWREKQMNPVGTRRSTP